MLGDCSFYLNNRKSNKYTDMYYARLIESIARLPNSFIPLGNKLISNKVDVWSMCIHSCKLVQEISNCDVAFCYLIYFVIAVVNFQFIAICWMGNIY